MQLQVIQKKIHEIRGQKVMLDFDLAELYGVQTGKLNEKVKRNIKRFPEDFMFQLTKEEWNSMLSQFATASQNKRNLNLFPYAFTEQGVSMLSGILNSDTAIEMNINIMRAFVFMKQYALSHKDLTDKLKELEDKYNQKFSDVYEAINYLLNKDKIEIEHKQRKQIGYKTKEK